MEFVEIWNKNSGARISTYVILGERGSRCCVLNGAAARTCQPGDQAIICNSVYVHERELTAFKPGVLTFDKDNRIVDRLTYSVARKVKGDYSFSILDGARNSLRVPTSQQAAAFWAAIRLSATVFPSPASPTASTGYRNLERRIEGGPHGERSEGLNEYRQPTMPFTKSIRAAMRSSCSRRRSSEIEGFFGITIRAGR